MTMEAPRIDYALDPNEDLWAQAQMRKLRSQCASCGKPCESDDWAECAELGSHLMCKLCSDSFNDEPDWPQ